MAEQRRLHPSLQAVLRWLAPLAPPVHIALEATLYWAWLHDRLTVAGYQVAVAQAYDIDLQDRRDQERGRLSRLPSLAWGGCATARLAYICSQRVTIAGQLNRW